MIVLLFQPQFRHWLSASIRKNPNNTQPYLHVYDYFVICFVYYRCERIYTEMENIMINNTVNSNKQQGF